VVPVLAVLESLILRPSTDSEVSPEMLIRRSHMNSIGMLLVHAEAKTRSAILETSGFHANVPCPF
jgi:hypothetical protein